MLYSTTRERLSSPVMVVAGLPAIVSGRPLALSAASGPDRRGVPIVIGVALHAAVLALLLTQAIRPAVPPDTEPAAMAMVFAPSAAPQAVAPSAATSPASPPPAEPPQQLVPPPPTTPPNAAPEDPPPVSAPKPMPAPAPPLTRQAQTLSLPPPRPAPRVRQAAKPPRRIPPKRSVEPDDAQARDAASPLASASASAEVAQPSSAPGPAATEPATVPAPAAKPSDNGAGWRSALAAWLQAHKTYPDIARRSGDQGRVVLRFTVARNGDVLRVEQVDGSGSAVLDAAAQAMLRGAHLPPFPDTMAGEQTTITVGIRYDLRD